MRPPLLSSSFFVIHVVVIVCVEAATAAASARVDHSALFSLFVDPRADSVMLALVVSFSFFFYLPYIYQYSINLQKQIIGQKVQKGQRHISKWELQPEIVDRNYICREDIIVGIISRPEHGSITLTLRLKLCRCRLNNGNLPLATQS